VSARVRPLMAALLLLAGTGFAEERVPLNGDWAFVRADAAASAAPESGWRTVQVPHDWSIEHATSPAAASRGGGGYFETGTAWYRKRFDAPVEWADRDVSIHFDGVYRNATVWLNGAKIGEHAYGYTPFRLPASGPLRPGASNELLVRVANEPQPDSRWYSGSGIVRPVRLEVRPDTHVEPDSLFVSTRALGPDGATVNVSVTIANADRLGDGARVRFVMTDPDGREVAQASVEFTPAGEGKPTTVRTPLTVPAPRAWSPDSPTLYTLTAALLADDRTVETVRVPAGLRTLHWSAARGFELNGEPVELFGGSVHHDHGPLGAAAYADAERRKVRLLKQAGFNAVRTAHNPPSDAFLDAADELGLLVIDEAFDGWRIAKVPYDYSTLFDAHWEADLRAMILRDRRHPSVVMWSIGNEVYERGQASGIDIAHAMASVVRQLDTTRPVTIGLNGLGATGDWSRLDTIFDALDIAGYNYELARAPDDHDRRPNRVVYASESYQAEAFANWQLVHDHAYVIGDFVWSAIDYLGEAGIGRVFPGDEEARPHWVGEHYPYHGALSGDIDITGFRKPISHYRNIVWNKGETLYAAVQVPAPGSKPWNLTAWSVPPALSTWTWPGEEGSDLVLDVYSRHPLVRVTLDGEPIGVAPTAESEAFRTTFTVPYRPGRLEVRAGDETFVLETAGEAARLSVANRDELRTCAEQRLCFAIVEITDADGTWHPAADRPIRFSVEGGRVLGVGSGDMASTESYRANPRRSYQGRSMLVFEPDPSAQRIVIRAEADGLAPAEHVVR